MIYLQLFLSFLQVGMFSFGGGYAAMPLIQGQVVTGHHWLSMSEFTDLITISQMTPGPIAVNSATFVGIKIAGIPGALAATFGYCPTYLSKMFRQYGRINYKDYLRSIRFEHALRELEETDLTIGEIALKNGFPNSQAFSRLFREKYGILPTEYQRRQKENDSAAFLMIQIQAESSLLGRL